MKKVRFGPRLVNAAANGAHYGDVHVFIGGTGAVGGAAVLQMITMFEEMMSSSTPPLADQVPVLLVTGRHDDDLAAFEEKLRRFIQSRWHGEQPRKFEHGYLTPSGVYIAPSVFQLKPIPLLDELSDAKTERPSAAVEAFLAAIGTSMTAPGDEVRDALLRHVSNTNALSGFLSDAAQRLRDYGPKPYESVLLGIPIPSVLAYQMGSLKHVISVAGLGERFEMELKHAFEEGFASELERIRDEWGVRIIVAHTTGVGGMYDELPDGSTMPRLGFAHAGRDQFLRQKHEEAERMTAHFARRGILMLVTAAAIGVDEVRIRERVPLHNDATKKLRELGRPLFESSQQKKRLYLRVVHPKTIPLRSDTVTGRRAFFRVDEELTPEYTIRSGENGFFSAANADALYRVMKVASASELGHVLASVALLGDDPQSPWFTDGVCEYRETANSRQVFEFLYQPELFETQLSGLDPMTLQDLGSAKHQAELHMLGLLIVLHRLQTADFDALGQYPSESFDARRFLIDSSRPLVFDDIEKWDVPTLAQQLRTLVTAETAKDLLPLKPLRIPGRFEARDAAHMRILERILLSVRSVCSFGSPIVFEDDAGESLVRTGFWLAPLGQLVEDDTSIARAIRVGLDAIEGVVPIEDYEAYEIAVNGFVDIRPLGIVCSAKTPKDLVPGRVDITRDWASFREAMGRLAPYSFFATSGLLALVYRLRALGQMLNELRTDLGSMQDWLWQMPRDRHGHFLVVPGVVEALRMISEGQEKASGIEWIDGIWGYERRLPRSRASEVIAAVFNRKTKLQKS